MELLIGVVLILSTGLLYSVGADIVYRIKSKE